MSGEVVDRRYVAIKKKQKPRKTYTKSKVRESWTKAEHQRFVQGVKLFERDWKRIVAYVKTKSVIQIRSHAQKYFLKMEKLGKGDLVPPPRPKRKSQRSRSGGAAPKRSPKKHKTMDIQEPKPQQTLPVATTPTGPITMAAHANFAVPMVRVAPSPSQTAAVIWDEVQAEQFNLLMLREQNRAFNYLSQSVNQDQVDMCKVQAFLSSLFSPSETLNIQLDTREQRLATALLGNLVHHLEEHSSSSGSDNSSDSDSFNIDVKSIISPSKGSAFTHLTSQNPVAAKSAVNQGEVITTRALPSLPSAGLH